MTCEVRAAETLISACGNSDGTGLSGIEMIGVESFDQRGHQLDGMIVAVRGCTSISFKQNTDDQIEVLAEALDRSSLRVRLVTSLKRHLEERDLKKAELLELPERLVAQEKLHEKGTRRVRK